MEQTQKPPLFFIYLTTFVTIVGFGMVFPLLPYYVKHFNASETTLGLLASSFAIAQFLLSPIWGRISDKYGRKPVIAIAVFGLSASFLVFALAQNITWLFIGRILQGIFAAASLPVTQAYVSDVTTKEQRIKGMGNLGASLSAGFIFGPGIGGILAGIHFSFPFYIAAGIAFLNFISVLLFLPESLSKKSEVLQLKEGFFNIKHMFKSLKGELGSFFILVFLWSFALTNNEIGVPLFGSEQLNIGAGTIGYFFSAQGLLAALMQTILIYKITHIFKEHKTVVLGLSIMALGLFLVPFAKNQLFLLLFMVLMTFGSSMSRPTLATLVSKETKEGQGVTMGIFASFESLGRVIGPLMAGWAFANFGFHAPFTITAVLILFTLLFVVQINRRTIFPSKN